MVWLYGYNKIRRFTVLSNTTYIIDSFKFFIHFIKVEKNVEIECFMARKIENIYIKTEV